MSNASAPGKVILFGEHAVVYGRPALAVPVLQVQADVEISPSDRAGIWIEAPDIFLYTELSALSPTHALHNVIHQVFRFLGISTPPPLNIKITSTIPVASGLGSGAAVSVALIRALSSTVHHPPLSNKQVNQLAFEFEKLHHGTPSGIDNTVITYAMPVYFVHGQPLETLRVGAPFTLVIADTGVSAPTKESVGDVRKLWQADPPRWERVFDQVGAIARQARAAIEAGNTSALGPLMDANHVLLQALTVSSPELDRLVLTAKSAGAEGAKVSGGGRGGNMIALVQTERAEAVAAALRSAGARSTIITTVQ